jgi:phosphohistidine phosphatase
MQAPDLCQNQPDRQRRLVSGRGAVHSPLQTGPTVRALFSGASPMKLILLRHAKSDWDDPLQDDHDRPLNARGRASAPAIGAWLVNEGHVPDLVLCSTAARTRETLRRLGLPPAQTRFSQRLYLASSAALLRALTVEKAATILLIAHNPGIGDLAMDLLDTPPRDTEIATFPTAACLVLEFDGPPVMAGGRMVDFTTPRKLDVDIH